MSFKEVPKGVAFDNIMNKLPDELTISVLGAGPGQLCSRVALEDKPYYTQKYILRPLNDFIMNTDISPGTWQYPWCTFLAIFGEIGVLGAIIYYALLLSVFIKILKNIKLKLYFSIPISEMLAFSLLCFIILYAMETFVYDGVDSISSPLIWILSGILLFPKMKKDDRVWVN
jgi:hypothetical protein